MAQAKYKRTIHRAELNESQLAFKATLDDLIKKVKKTKAKRDAHLESCTHALSHDSDTLFGDGRVWCEICDKNFGWYCSKSPDQSCHYFTEDSKILLNDGTLVDVPRDEEDVGEPYNDKWETDDSCLFCGAPDERK